MSDKIPLTVEERNKFFVATREWLGIAAYDSRVLEVTHGKEQLRNCYRCDISNRGRRSIRIDFYNGSLRELAKELILDNLFSPNIPDSARDQIMPYLNLTVMSDLMADLMAANLDGEWDETLNGCCIREIRDED